MSDVVPSQALQDSVATLVAAGSILSPATNKFRLVKSAFTPSPATVPADYTVADFTGSAALVTATVAVYTDPTTGLQEIRPAPPVGGLKWSPTDATNLPQTIYGFVFTDTTAATVIGSALLPTPIVLTAAGQLIDIGAPVFRLPLNPLGP